ncbi:MAG: ATP-binding protein [Oscillospiraceae bacterium]|nr:ATP-binding protein [Oscillospiraceae bacterium]
MLSLFDFAVWVLKYHKWPEETTKEMVMQTFVNMYHLTDKEISSLFTQDIEGYPVSNPFRPNAVAWEDLCNSIEPAPDATPSRGATLSFLELKNVGPASSIIMEPNSRLNIITGDNGLGKSFVMECSWWALTGEWCDDVARPMSVTSKPTISYALANKKGIPMKEIVKYDKKNGTWPKSKNAPSIPGLIVYARVDGSYAVWDPAQQYDVNTSSKHVFTREEVWNGSEAIEGLLRDWVSWQRTSNSDESSFEVLKKVLKEMSPPDMGELTPGTPIRTLNDKREIPTIVHPYGEVPITNASAGVRRVITLAYLIVWAWNEHNIP